MKEKNKIKLIIILCGILLISIIIFIFYYKNKNTGNNMSNKTIEDIEAYILNISSYEANMDITIESNKNKSEYKIQQTYQKDKISKQTVLEPSNIQGMETIYQNGTLTIEYSKLNLSTIYKNYPYMADNFLWLDAFIKDYQEAKNKNEASINEENDIVVMKAKTRNENNRYVYQKELYIDKKTGKPTKFFVQDINKKNLVYILYNEITVNGLQ